MLIFRGFLINSHLSSVRGTVYVLFSENWQTSRFPRESSGKLTKAINVKNAREDETQCHDMQSSQLLGVFFFSPP